jgi:hypothetical protein
MAAHLLPDHPKGVAAGVPYAASPPGAINRRLPMTYDKNYSGSTGSSGSASGGTGGTGSTGSYGRSGSSFGGSQGSYGSSQGYGSQGYGSQGYGSGYGSPYAGYESWGGYSGQSMGSGGKMLAGLILGAAAGAAIALLMAPTSGRETRQNLSRWARDTRNKATEMAGNLRQRYQHGGSQTDFSSSPGVPGGVNEDRNIPEL